LVGIFIWILVEKLKNKYKLTTSNGFENLFLLRAFIMHELLKQHEDGTGDVHQTNNPLYAICRSALDFCIVHSNLKSITRKTHPLRIFCIVFQKRGPKKNFLKANVTQKLTNAASFNGFQLTFAIMLMIFSLV
jgi:hypothetical protein